MEQTHTDSSPSPQAGSERPRRSASGTVLRVVVWMITIQVALQPVFAGMLLEGDQTGRMLHLINGSLIELTALLLLVASIVAWRPGRAPGRVAVAGSLMFVVLYAQAGLGHAGMVGMHVPLGVASLVLMLWLLIDTRRIRPTPKNEK